MASRTDKPAEEFHPGEFILEELEARGWSIVDLAERIGGDVVQEQLALEFYFAAMADPTMNRSVVLGEKGAQDIGRAFGVSPEFFVNLERSWLSGGTGTVVGDAEAD